VEGGTLDLDELQFNTGKQRHLKELLLKNSWSNISYIVDFEDYLTNTVLVINSYLKFLF